MKPANLLMVVLTAASVAVQTGCSKLDHDDVAAGADNKGAAAVPGKPGVTLDAETQERLGLKIESPVSARWQPGIHGTGRVANPLAFIAAATDYETARSAAASSQAELERTQKLAAQENASPRVLEAAQTAAMRDALALQAARAKFTADWGARLAGQTNLTMYAGELQGDGLSLVRLQLPAGSFPNPLPETATITLLGNDTNAVSGELADNLNIDPATQVQTLLFTVRQKLPPDISVEAELKMPGAPVDGVVVPAAAVIRYNGLGWVYVQTDTNQFARSEVPLDRLMTGGWFVSGNLSVTNRIVAVGAQSVLSAELVGGGFNTGSRD